MRLRAALLLVVACGAGEPPGPAAPVVAPRCGEASLRAFAADLAGSAVESLGELPDRHATAARERAEACTAGEDDDACRARARDAVAAEPGAAVEDVTLAGEADGYRGTLEVDGERRTVRVSEPDELAAEARRLQRAGHRVVPIAMHQVLRRAGRRAIVRYQVGPAGPPPRRWQVQLRWRPDGELTDALRRLQDAAVRRDLEVRRFEVGAGRAVTVLAACPR